jgi:O-methyltransferase
MIRPIKQACKSLLYRFGYEVRSVGKDHSVVGNKDFEAAISVKESQYYAQWVSPCPLFSPWLGHPEFQAIYEGASRYTLVSPDRCYILISLARYASHLAGDFAECGVYRGGTALMLARIIKNSGNKKLYLFDSFQGLPKVDREKDQWFCEGEFRVESVAAVEELLSDFLTQIDIRCGWIPKTFHELQNNQYAFAHLDVDLYQSNLDCCTYFYPRMAAGGVLLFDEYAFAAARGEKDAVDEFFSDKPETPVTLPTGQAIVLKLPSKERSLGAAEKTG